MSDSALWQGRDESSSDSQLGDITTPEFRTLTINGLTATTARMRMRVLSPANATLSAVSMGGGHYRLEVRGGTTGYTVQYSEP